MTEGLRFDRATRRFGAMTALRGLDLTCPPGSMTCLIGPNGAGKSTALALAAGLLSVSSGSVRLDSREIASETLAGSIGYLPQHSAFHPLLSGGEVLSLTAALRCADDEARREALEVSGLEASLERPAGELSGGSVRRLGLLAALLGAPHLLLLDEPFVGLDPQTLDRLLAHLERRLAETATVVVASHDFDVMDRFEPRVAVLNQGRLELLAAPGSGPSRALYRQALQADACGNPAPHQS